MWESIQELFTSGDIWSIIVKVLITAILSAGVGIACTLLGKMLAKMKNSKIRKYAEICVRAAEQKFPNEGKKMGPEKMAYVMDQLAIKFPKIKENTYLYNIAEAAVYELNRERQQEDAVKEFEEKYGEKPLAVQEQQEDTSDETTVELTAEPVSVSNTTSSKGTQTKLKSF